MGGIVQATVQRLDTMMSRTALFAAAISLALVCTPIVADSAYAQKRVALVIGNSSYRNVPFLANPVKDAQAMAAKFKEAGFAVINASFDVGYLSFKRAIRDFEDAAGEADINVIYYAGHGIEVDGINYMIPVDARLATTRDAQDEAITLDRLLEAGEGAKQLSLVILDSCRDNPFVHMKPKRTAALRSVTVKPGVTIVEPTHSNTLIYYAARKGSGAEDGDGDHSPFTTALLKYLFVPGQDIRFAFGKVRDEVLKQTGSKQEPFVTGTFGDTIVALNPAPEAPVPAGRGAKPVLDGQAEQIEKDHYEFVKEVGSVKAWKVFLLQHPNGFYSDLARAQLDKAEKLAVLQPDKQPSATPTPTSEEQRTWDRIKDTSNAALLRDFIKRYPTSPLANTAQTRLDAIEREAKEREENARKEREAKAAEEARQKAEREAALKRAEEERKARAAEEARQKAEREAVLKRAEEERLKKLAAEEAQKKAEREAARKREEEERAAKAAEAARQKAERDAVLKREEEERRVKAAAEAERQRVEREAARKREEEERAVQAAEAERQKAERDAVLKREEEERRAKAAAEAERQRVEREAARKREEEERAAQAAEAARQKAEHEAALKREEEEQRAKAATEAERQRVEREAALKRAEEERQAKAAEAARQKAERDAALKRAEEERQAKAAAEAERQRVEREAALKRAEEERQAKAAEAARQKAEREAALKRAEEERAAKAAVEAERARIEREAALKRAEEERQAKEAEAARLKGEREAALKRAEEERAAKAAAEAERQRIEREAALKRAEEERTAKAAEAERQRAEREAALQRAEEERKAKVELVRSAQVELARIGCYVGTPDGEAGAGTREAIKRYQTLRNQKVSNIEINEGFVSELREQSARICPLTCPPGKVAEGEICVVAQPPAVAPAAAPVVRHNVEPEPRRERAKQEEPRTRPVARQRDNEEKPVRRERASREEPRRERASREESRPRVRQEASSPRSSGGGGGGGGGGGHGPIGVGF
jgi:Caspase domain/Putative peptidoglycan binding domain